MTKDEKQRVIKIHGPNFKKTDIPTFIRNRDREELLNEHINAEIMLENFREDERSFGEEL